MRVFLSSEIEREERKRCCDSQKVTPGEEEQICWIFFLFSSHCAILLQALVSLKTWTDDRLFSHTSYSQTVLRFWEEGGREWEESDVGWRRFLSFLLLIDYTTAECTDVCWRQQTFFRDFIPMPLFCGCRNRETGGQTLEDRCAVEKGGTWMSEKRWRHERVMMRKMWYREKGC